MKVTCDNYTPLTVAANAIRQCWQSQDKSDSEGFTCGEADKSLIERIGNKMKHKSTLEHLNYNFTIEGISRACLQELARHRIASYSVKSSRYTLKELKSEELFIIESSHNMSIKSSSTKNTSILTLNEFLKLNPKLNNKAEIIEKNYNRYVRYQKTIIRASKYIVLTGEYEVDVFSIRALENLRKATQAYKNDISKYCMPECFKTSLAWSINARSLQNFLELRTSKAALWEIRKLAKAVFESLPEEHKYLFENCCAE